MIRNPSTEATQPHRAYYGLRTTDYGLRTTSYALRTSPLHIHPQFFERGREARREDIVVARPAAAVFPAGLPNVQLRPVAVDRTSDLERHRADGVTVGRQPIGVGDEE